MKPIFALFLVGCLAYACEDEIAVNTADSVPLIAIDAWLYRTAETQRIFISRTQDYFDNSSLDGVSSAVVRVTDEDNNVFNFTENAPGEYIWEPISQVDSFGTIGNLYYLDIQLGETRYTATSRMGRVPRIDSITFRFEEAQGDFFPESYFAEFWARDVEGIGDAYWIKSWKNGIPNNKPSEINISFDGAFSEDGNADGLVFIQPIRDGINPINTDENDNFLPPFELDAEDSVYVELNSITPEAFFFLNQVIIQTDRPGGFAELFAVPLANVSSNIISSNTKEQVVGFFCASAVSSLGRKISEDAIRSVD